MPRRRLTASRSRCTQSATRGSSLCRARRLKIQATAGGAPFAPRQRWPSLFDCRRRAQLIRSALVDMVTGPRPDVKDATSGAVFGLKHDHRSRPSAADDPGTWREPVFRNVLTGHVGSTLTSILWSLVGRHAARPRKDAANWAAWTGACVKPTSHTGHGQSLGSHGGVDDMLRRAAPRRKSANGRSTW